MRWQIRTLRRRSGQSLKALARNDHGRGLPWDLDRDTSLVSVPFTLWEQSISDMCGVRACQVYGAQQSSERIQRALGRAKRA